MDTKLFKAFTAYKHGVRFDPVDVADKISERSVTDPGATSWRSIGFIDVLTNEPLVDLQGGGYLACVQVNDRVLPGAVIREAMSKMIVSIEQRDGRKPSKKQYAEIKDEAILELLPKAFIRRKYIPVFFSGDTLIVFTSSAKLADDVTFLLTSTIDFKGNGPVPLISRVKEGPGMLFTQLAEDGQNTPNSGVGLQSSDAVVLKLGKKTIRVKDIDVETDHIQRLMEQEYEIVQMAIEQRQIGHDDYSAKFLLNEFLVFSGYVLPNQGGRSKGKDEDFVGAAWLAMDTIKTTIAHLIKDLGGLKEVESKQTDDDDDL